MIGYFCRTGALRLNAGDRFRRCLVPGDNGGMSHVEGPGRCPIQTLVGGHRNSALGRGLGDGFPDRRQIVLAKIQTIAAGARMSDDMHMYVLAVMVSRKHICPPWELVVESVLDCGEEWLLRGSRSRAEHHMNSVAGAACSNFRAPRPR